MNNTIPKLAYQWNLSQDCNGFIKVLLDANEANGELYIAVLSGDYIVPPKRLLGICINELVELPIKEAKTLFSKSVKEFLEENYKNKPMPATNGIKKYGRDL